jgi:hypothetical protein
MQKRLKKYSRDATSLAAVASRQITDTSIAIIATIHDYRFIPTSSLVRLVQGHDQTIHRHLKQLYHKRLINRFAFMRNKNPGEFHYYLDNSEALKLLINHGANAQDLALTEVAQNREKRYSELNEEKPGRLLFLKHEVMISRFHAMLELACRQSAGLVKLTEFHQGAALWNRVEAPKMTWRGGRWYQLSDTEHLPHRPDAFFILSFPSQPDREPLRFFYEADRQTTDTNTFKIKLRAHFHFAVKQKERLKEIYGINRIRAVLTETIDPQWAMRLREAADHPLVSGSKPSSLFWFTTSRLFTGEKKAGGEREQPVYLKRPGVIFDPIWATPVDDTLHSLID